jgi:hypothetical protein
VSKSISNGAAIARPGANFGGPQGVVVLQRSRDRSCQRWRGWTNPAFGCYLRQLCPPEIHPRHQSTVHKLDKCDTSVTLWDICLQPAKARPIHPPTVGDALRGRLAARAYLECISRAPAKPEIRLRYSMLVGRDTKKGDTERLGNFSISKIFEIPYLVPHLNEIHLFGCISTQIRYLGTSGVRHHHQTDHTTQHLALSMADFSH